jgi:hypothetical protein
VRRVHWRLRRRPQGREHEGVGRRFRDHGCAGGSRAGDLRVQRGELRRARRGLFRQGLWRRLGQEVEGAWILALFF